MINFTLPHNAPSFKVPYFGQATNLNPNPFKKIITNQKAADSFSEVKKSNVSLSERTDEGVHQFRDILNSIRRDLEKGSPIFLKSEENDGIHKIHFKLNDALYTVRKFDESHYEFKKKVTKRFSPVNQFRLEVSEQAGKVSFFLQKGLPNLKGLSSFLVFNYENKSLAAECKELGKDVFQALKDSLPPTLKD
jgi:hypothetical protein